MKNLTTICIFLICTITFKFVCSQSEKTAITETFNNFFIEVQEKNYQKSLEYIFADFFKYKSKKEILDELNFSESESLVPSKITKYTIEDIKEVFYISNSGYTKMTVIYHAQLDLFNLKQIPKGKESGNMSDIIDGFKNKDTYNVVFDSINYVLELDVRKEYFVIYKKKIGKWKLLENDLVYNDIHRKILPKELIERK